jgi:hypothetical protein
MSKFRVNKEFSRISTPERIEPVNGIGTYDFRYSEIDFLETDSVTSEQVLNFPQTPFFKGLWDVMGPMHDNIWTKYTWNDDDFNYSRKNRTIKSVFGNGESYGNEWQGMNRDFLQLGNNLNQGKKKPFPRNFSAIGGNAEAIGIPYFSNKETIFSTRDFSVVNLRDHLRNVAFNSIGEDWISDRFFDRYVNKTAEVPTITDKFNYFNNREGWDIDQSYVTNFNVMSYVKFDEDNLLVLVSPVNGRFNGVGIKNVTTDEWVYRPTYDGMYQILKLNLSTGRFDLDFKFKRSNGDLCNGFGYSYAIKMFVSGDSIFIKLGDSQVISFDNPEVASYEVSSDLIKFDLDGTLDEDFFGKDESGNILPVRFNHNYNEFNIFNYTKNNADYFYFVTGGISELNGIIYNNELPLVLRSKADGSEHEIVLDDSYYINTKSSGSLSVRGILSVDQLRNGDLVMLLSSGDDSLSLNNNYGSFYANYGYGYIVKFKTLTDEIDQEFGFIDESIYGDFSSKDLRYIFPKTNQNTYSDSFVIYASKYDDSIFLYGSSFNKFALNPFSETSKKLYGNGIGGIIKLNYDGELDLDFGKIRKTLDAYYKDASPDNQYVYNGVGPVFGVNSYFSALVEPAYGELYLQLGNGFDSASVYNEEKYETWSYMTSRQDYHGRYTKYQQGVYIKIYLDGKRDKSFKYEFYSNASTGYDKNINRSELIKYNGKYIMFGEIANTSAGVRLWTDYYHANHGKLYSSVLMEFKGRLPRFDDPANWEEFKPSTIGGMDAYKYHLSTNTNNHPYFDSSPSNYVGIIEFDIENTDTVEYQERSNIKEKISVDWSRLGKTSLNWNLTQFFYNKPINERNVEYSENEFAKYVAGLDYNEEDFLNIKNVFTDLFTNEEYYPDKVDFKLSPDDPSLVYNLYPEWKNIPGNEIPPFEGSGLKFFGWSSALPYFDIDNASSIIDIYGETITVLPEFRGTRDELNKFVTGNKGDVIWVYQDGPMFWNDSKNMWHYDSFFEDFIDYPLNTKLGDKFWNLRQILPSIKPFAWANYYTPKAFVNNYVQNEM